MVSHEHFSRYNTHKLMHFQFMKCTTHSIISKEIPNWSYTPYTFYVRIMHKRRNFCRFWKKKSYELGNAWLFLESFGHFRSIFGISWILANVTFTYVAFDHFARFIFLLLKSQKVKWLQFYSSAEKEKKINWRTHMKNLSGRERKMSKKRVKHWHRETACH